MTVVAAGAALTDLFAQPFVRHAFVAGTAVAIAAGLIGYFLVLRAQVFTVDAIGHVAYTGALGALAFGAGARVGLYLATVVVAVGLSGLGGRAKPDDVVIGSTFAWALGLGSLFLTLYITDRSTADATASVTYLFGSIYGLSAADATTTALVAAAVCVALLFVTRPLLFASVDRSVAAARGVPVRLLGVGFLVLVGVTTAEAARAVGGLLILGLVAAPAGAAHRMTTRPLRGLALSAGIAVASTWAGLVLSYLAPQIPPSFGILSVATAVYLGAAVVPTKRTRAARSESG